MNIAKILVGTDFSDCSALALSHAISLARRLGASIELVHVCPMAVAAFPEMTVVPTLESTEIEALKRELDKVRAEAVREGVAVQTHLRFEDPVAGMLAYIKELQPDLVVVGSHGRGAVMRALMGSVSEKICRQSTVPVLVIPGGPRAQRADLSGDAAAAMEHARDAAPLAWACAACGHIRQRLEPTGHCPKCKVDPPRWVAAPMLSGPADEAEPSVGDVSGDDVSASETSYSSGFASVSPPGVSGVSINPELRVRY